MLSNARIKVGNQVPVRMTLMMNPNWKKLMNRTTTTSGTFVRATISHVGAGSKKCDLRLVLLIITMVH